MRKIIISGNEYPIRFDYMVLRALSEKYDSIRQFEMDLRGWTVAGTDKDGNEIMKKTKEPSVRCIMFLLPLMINSALDYQGFAPVDEEKIIKEIDLNFTELAIILHNEMKTCFKSCIPEKKKNDPTPEG